MPGRYESGDVQHSQVPASRMETQNQPSSSMYIIFLVLIIDLLGFTVILPLMPSIFKYYEANEKVNIHILNIYMIDN